VVVVLEDEDVVLVGVDVVVVLGPGTVVVLGPGTVVVPPGATVVVVIDVVTAVVVVAGEGEGDPEGGAEVVATVVEGWAATTVVVDDSPGLVATTAPATPAAPTAAATATPAPTPPPTPELTPTAVMVPTIPIAENPGGSAELPAVVAPTMMPGSDPV